LIQGFLPDGNYTVQVRTSGEPGSTGILNFSLSGAPFQSAALNLVPNTMVTVNFKEEFKSGQSVFGDTELFRRDQSDLDGTFRLQSVIPGSYTVVAVQDAWGFQWLEPGVLARYVQHGENVTVGELMQETLHLPDPVELQPR
jgi:hypothetical protein